MNKILFFVFCCFAFLNVTAQNTIPKLRFKSNRAAIESTLSRTVNISSISSKASMESWPRLALSTDGLTFKEYYVAQKKLASTQSKALNTYVGYAADGSGDRIKIASTKEYFVAVVAVSNGFKIITESTEAGYMEVEEVQSGSFTCGVDLVKNNEQASNSSIKLSDAGVLKTYELAIMLTQEYYANAGNNNTAVEAKVVANVMGLSLFYERELSITFELKAHPVSGLLFYLDNSQPGSDYYQNLIYVDATLDAQFTSGYDIGHCFHYISSGGSGVASLGVICGSFKGRGWSGSSSVSGSNFYNIFFHEIAHQFGSNHTYNSASGNCSGQRAADFAYEPGSGSTLMSYAGICSPQDIQNGGEFYFHHKSLEAIAALKNSTTCATNATINNAAPVVNAGGDITVPLNTPFYLNGSATDINGDKLTYTWEQYNITTNANALGSIAGSSGISAVNDPNSPLFRSFYPSEEDSRYFPSLQYSINNLNVAPNLAAEALSNVARNITFRLVARDNNVLGNAIGTDEMQVVVSGTAGPFTLTYPNGGEALVVGTPFNVTWDVNNTNSISSNVRIELSVDGGYTYPVFLGSSANDGSAQVTIPNTIENSAQARIRIASVPESIPIPGGGSTSSSRSISAVGVSSFFYDISNANFNLAGSTCSLSNTVICDDAPQTYNQGSVNLSLSKVAGNIKNSFDLTISTASPLKPIFFQNTDGVCVQISSNYYTTSFSFQVTKSGYYTFNLQNTAQGNISIFNQSTSTCANFMKSINVSLPGGFFSTEGALTVYLENCTTYYLDASTFESLPKSMVLLVSGAGNVLLTESISTTNMTYGYLALKKLTNTFAYYSSSSEFSTADASEYEIYGVHFLTSLGSSYLVNKSINQLNSLGACVRLSENFKPITIQCVTFPPAAITPVGPLSICSGGSGITLTSNSGPYSYKWLKNSISVGLNDMNTLSVTTPGNYSVEITQNGCKTISNVVQVNLATTPAAPTVNSPTIAYNTAATLTATGCSSGVRWFSSPSTSTVLSSANPFFTGTLVLTTNYYVACVEGDCESNRTTATVTVTPNPCPPSITLSSTANDYTSGTVLIQTQIGAVSGLITATNNITGGTITYDSSRKIELLPGFSVGNGAVFTAKIGGCNPNL